MLEKLRKKHLVRSIIFAILMLAMAALLGLVMAMVEDGRLLFMIFIAILVALAVYFIYSGVTASNMKDLNVYLNSQGNREWAIRRIEEFCNAVPPVNGLRINNEFFMKISGTKIDFAMTEEVVWVYMRVTKHSVNLIPTGKTYAIAVMLEDGDQMAFDAASKKRAEAMLDYIVRAMPYIFVGYDNEILGAYMNNRQEFVNVVRERRAGYIAQLPENRI